MKKLHIADDLDLPLDAVTQTFAILAKRGVGKTHTASILAEEMLKAGQPIVVYDPTGAWWGLKSSADGKRPAYPVVVFGGEHADVPLEETAGATIAEVVVAKRMPAILDCGLMRKGARIRFMTDFCETLYHKNREALHFFVDEAQTIAPQNLKAMPEAARLLGAMEDIVLQGRRRGLGMTIISPRPAVVNTNIRSACEVIIAMQIVSPHDRKAIEEWVDVHGDDEQRGREMLQSLTSLKRGEAWVWSPSWLETFQRVKFRGRETFDSSATPKIGQRIVQPKKLAAVDIKALGAEIAATVERTKADDPKLLKKRIADLEAAAKKVKPAESVAVPILTDAERKQLLAAVEKCRAILDKTGESYTAAVGKFDAAVEKCREFVGRPLEALQAKLGKPIATPARSDVTDAMRYTLSAVTPRGRVSPRPVTPTPTSSGSSNAGSGDDAVGKGGLRRILTALAHRPSGLSTRQIGVRAQLSSSSGTFDTYLSKARQNGWIEGTRERLTITNDGLRALGDIQPMPTGPELLRYWLGELGGGASRMLEVIAAAYPQALSRAEVGERALLSAGSGTFDTYLSKLRSLELVEGKGELRASEELFDG